MYGNTTMTKLLFDEFINGHQRNLSKEEEEFIEKVFSNVSDYNSVKVVHSSWLNNKEQKNQCKIRTHNLVHKLFIFLTLNNLKHIYLNDILSPTSKTTPFLQKLLSPKIT